MDNIFDYVTKQKTEYEAGVGVPVAGSWNWRMFDHINYTMLMKNGQFPITQTKMGERPNKNIIIPILNVAHRTEGFDVKDIEPYVNDPDYYHLSLLVRKYHEAWALRYSIDTFIDEVVEALDYGFVLVKNVDNKRPEVVQPQQIAFCDQTDMLSGTIALKHQYSVDQLLDTVADLGWYQDAVDEAILYASDEKTNDQSQGQAQKTPSKYVEVYEVHGTFKDSTLFKEGDAEYNASLDSAKYSKQFHAITYTKDADGNKKGITLFKGKEPKSVFKFMSINPIYGRAAGRGRVEDLFEPQIWTNFNMIHMSNMLREASKVLYLTTDHKFDTNNNTKNTVSGQFLKVEQGQTVGQLNTQPANIALFDRSNEGWEQHARVTGSASDPALGLDPTSGTPLGTTQIVTAQGQGIHEYIRGKVAVFMNEIYSDWVVSYLQADMVKGDKWLAELSLEELNEVADKFATNEANARIKQMILEGKMPTTDVQKQLTDMLNKDYIKGGSKRFMEIVKGELKDIPLKVRFNIAGKQKNLGKNAEKITNLFRTAMMNPQGFIMTMKIPGMAKTFNELLEESGLSPITFDFSDITDAEMAGQADQTGQPIPSPLQLPQAVPAGQ